MVDDNNSYAPEVFRAVTGGTVTIPARFTSIIFMNTGSNAGTIDFGDNNVATLPGGAIVNMPSLGVVYTKIIMTALDPTDPTKQTTLQAICVS